MEKKKTTTYTVHQQKSYVTFLLKKRQTQTVIKSLRLSIEQSYKTNQWKSNSFKTDDHASTRSFKDEPLNMRTRALQILWRQTGVVQLNWTLEPIFLWVCLLFLWRRKILKTEHFKLSGKLQNNLNKPFFFLMKTSFVLCILTRSK